METTPTPAPKPKRNWLPTTKDGKTAVALCLAAIIWGLLLPFIPKISRGIIRAAGSGLITMSIEVILVILGLIFSIKAIFKVKERAILSILIFVIFCVIGGFWLMFAIGEIVSPH